MRDLVKTTITSMEVAQMVGKEHSKLLRDIREYSRQLAEAKIGLGDFFEKSSYLDANNQSCPFLLMCARLGRERQGQQKAEQSFEPKSSDSTVGKEGKKVKQTIEEMQRKIQVASNRKILRRQLEMLAEYSRTCGVDRAPEASQAMASLHRRLVKAESWCFVRFVITLFAFLYFCKCFPVKGVKFVKR